MSVQGISLLDGLDSLLGLYEEFGLIYLHLLFRCSPLLSRPLELERALLWEFGDLSSSPNSATLATNSVIYKLKGFDQMKAEIAALQFFSLQAMLR